MKKTYKLIAETTNGVTLVDSFDDFHGIEIIDEEAFLDNLDYLSDNDTIGAEVSEITYESIKEEYGVRNKEKKMIVRVRYNDGGDRFEDVMNVNNREEAIQEAIYNFVVNKGYYTSVCLVECEGESIEDFYEMEEKQGGYNPFWDMKESK